MRVRTAAFAFLALTVFSSATAAQATLPPDPPAGATGAQAAQLKVFLDCEFRCDFDYLRTNVAFVDWVRDRESSDIHLLVTTQGTGGGGTSWTLKFIGIGSLQGVDETLTFATASTATSDEQRTELARVIRLGLARYAVRTNRIDALDVTFRPEAAAAQTTPERDPWNYWVFNTRVNGNFGGERTNKNASLSLNLSANRVTENWKVNLSASNRYSENTFEISETDTVNSISRNWSASGLVVKSLTEHWSAGLRTGLTGSTFSNHDYSVSVMPGIEFDVFPYSESTRRSWTFLYSAGVARHNYDEITIFDKQQETVPQHSIGTDLGLRQPWGSVGASVSFSQHLNELSRNRLSLFGSADVRLFKGFSFNVFGDYSRIRDQINLRKGGASEEEILLRQRQLATGFEYFVGFGVSYRFGSIYNNIVNPRFRNF